MVVKNGVIFERFESTNKHLLELASVCYQKSKEVNENILAFTYYRDSCNIIVKKFGSILMFSELEILISYKDKKSHEHQLTLIIASNGIDVYKFFVTRQSKEHLDWIGVI